jgi:hypothetical protein
MQLRLFLSQKIIKQGLSVIPSRKRGSGHRLSSQFLHILTIFLWTSLLPLPVHAETNTVFQTDFPPADLVPALPASFGKIIYSFNAESPKQLYIIGISHRGSFSGNDAVTTIQTQSELYRIGEWLKRNRGLELLLPEGFFNGNTQVPVKHSAINVDDLPDESLLSLDDESLGKRLSDHSRFVNAEMLLMENLHMQAGQVEDRGLYDAVYNGLLRLGTMENDSQKYLLATSELRSLQKMRTAYILQKATEVIDARFSQGTMQKKQALLTIGLNHLQEIIRSIHQNEINIDSPFAGQDNYVSELNLIKEGYGISVIIPQVLAADRTVLEMTGLDGILHMASLQTTDEP